MRVIKLQRKSENKGAVLVRCPRLQEGPSVSHLPAARAGDEAFRIFCTPELSHHRSADHHVLIERARFHLRHARWEVVPTLAGPVQAYVFEPDGARRGTVLLVHGWTSEAAFMTAFIEPLRRSGYRVVAFDFPAHGHSPGRRTNLAQCARAMLGIAQRFGPVHAAVAHSFGGLVSLLVAEGGPPLPFGHPIERFVLLGCPNRLLEVTGNFGAQLGLDPLAQRVYERHLERVGHRPVSTFSAVNLLGAVGAPTLVIHGTEDREVPFRNAQEITSGCRSARLLAADGLGHRTMLYAPPVFRAVMSELTASPSVTAPSRRFAQSSAGHEMNASA
jgi:pimeloyl-ACP methyl ester carboxylesterase